MSVHNAAKEFIKIGNTNICLHQHQQCIRCIVYVLDTIPSVNLMFCVYSLIQRSTALQLTTNVFNNLNLKLKMASIQSYNIQNRFHFFVPIKNLCEFRTPNIIWGGLSWGIHVRKTTIGGKNERREVIDVVLMCNCHQAQSDDSRWWIEAGATLKLQSFDRNERFIEKKIPIMRFNPKQLSSELANFISWEDLIDENNMYIKNGEFAIEAVITASPQRKIAEASGFEISSAKFGMLIRNVNKLTSIDSPKVILCGNTWFVRFKRPKECIEINVYTERKEENFAWSDEASLKVKLLSDDISKSLERNFNHRFHAGSSSFGWNDFIEVATLLDAKNGYVSNLDQHAFFEISIDVNSEESIWKYEMEASEYKTPSTVSKCSICLEKFTDQEVLATVCGHLFCGDCVKESIEKHGKCPLCNTAAAVADLRAVYLYS